MAWAIEAEHLRKTYGDVVAVADVSLQVGYGECFALLGPNGAGKTTTTEILEGYRDRDSGHADVLGIDPRKRPRDWRAQIGIVLQNCRDLTDLTVHESVHHFAGYYPSPRKPDEVIELVGLQDKAKARTSQLSGGQRRRLDVALGIIGNPRLLFLDEPTTGFDPEARRQFWGLIDDLKAEGTTILLTTHYLDEAEALADRVAVISRGRVLACDTPTRLGGRDSREVTVRWQDTRGRVESRSTANPTATVQELAATFGGEVPGLEVVRPTLEDVYLHMIAADGNTNEAEALR
jgi:ABC-2 type transport system ATP-binding protein